MLFHLDAGRVWYRAEAGGGYGIGQGDGTGAIGAVDAGNERLGNRRGSAAHLVSYEVVAIDYKMARTRTEPSTQWFQPFSARFPDDMRRVCCATTGAKSANHTNSSIDAMAGRCAALENIQCYIQ